MRKLDQAFEAVWNELHRLHMDKMSVSDSTGYFSSVDFLRKNIRGIEDALKDAINTQYLLIASLVEAGILIEKKEHAKEYLEIGDKQYTIRKVK